MAWSKKFLQILLPLAVVAIALRFFFVQSLFLQTDRFSPTLLKGDFLYGVKSSSPERGDLVSYECMERVLCVGRVIGLPGDRLDFDLNKTVRVNGSRTFSLLFSDASQLTSPAVVVPPEVFFVEGDHFGEVLRPQINSIISRVILSVDPELRRFRLDRIWKAVH